MIDYALPTLGVARLVGEYAPGSTAWHDLRARRVGGSEIGALLGLSKWQSAFGLWQEKTGRLAPPPETPIMRFGTLIEPVIVQLWADDHPEFEVMRVGTFVHCDRDYQLSSPDRVLFGGEGIELLETKSAAERYEWGEPGTDEVPPDYLAQCRWQLDTFGFQRCRVAVLFGGRPPVREYFVEADPEDAAFMRREAAEFVRMLDSGEVPEIDGHVATWEAVRKLHPDIDRERDAEIDPEFAEHYRGVLAAFKAAEEAKQQVSGELVTAMAGARRAVISTNDSDRPEVIARREPCRGGTRLVPLPSRVKTGAA